jgi:hypothetical protein
MTRRGPLPLRLKGRLFVRSWLLLGRVSLDLRRRGLPTTVSRLEVVSPPDDPYGVTPVRLGRLVHRVLHLGPWRPRCLSLSLIVFRLLREQGVDAKVVIGLPNDPRDKDAHAWVEIDGTDVGPPPGRGTHVELARYG